MSKLKIFLFFLLLGSIFLSPSNRTFAQQESEIPAPPTRVEAFDTPNDNGHSITVSWTLSADDGAGKNNVVAYEVLRSDSPEGEFEVRGMAPAGESVYEDQGAKDRQSPQLPFQSQEILLHSQGKR
jgi:hypothetical protein